MPQLYKVQVNPQPRFESQIPDMKKHVKRMPELEKEKLLRAHARYVAVVDKYEKLIPFEETLKVPKRP